MDRKRQGDVGVAVAIAHYTAAGYTVSVPLSDAARYDLVVDDGTQLLRVQVKTTGNQRYGVYRVQLRTCGGNQSWTGTVRHIATTECDRVFVYTVAGEMYEFPSSFVAGRPMLNLGQRVSSYRIGAWPATSTPSEVKS